MDQARPFPAARAGQAPLVPGVHGRPALPRLGGPGGDPDPRHGRLRRRRRGANRREQRQRGTHPVSGRSRLPARDARGPRLHGGREHPWHHPDAGPGDERRQRGRGGRVAGRRPHRARSVLRVGRRRPQLDAGGGQDSGRRGAATRARGHLRGRRSGRLGRTRPRLDLDQPGRPDLDAGPRQRDAAGPGRPDQRGAADGGGLHRRGRQRARRRPGHVHPGDLPVGQRDQLAAAGRGPAAPRRGARPGRQVRGRVRETDPDRRRRAHG